MISTGFMFHGPTTWPVSRAYNITHWMILVGLHFIRPENEAYQKSKRVKFYDEQNHLSKQELSAFVATNFKLDFSISFFYPGKKIETVFLDTGADFESILF